MHQIMEYVNSEMKDLEHKIGNGTSLTLNETQYLDMLAHIKKSLLTISAMENEGYSNRRGRDSMGRYSRDDAKDTLIKHLKEMESNVNDEESRRMIDEWMRQANNY